MIRLTITASYVSALHPGAQLNSQRDHIGLLRFLAIQHAIQPEKIISYKHQRTLQKPRNDYRCLCPRKYIKNVIFITSHLTYYNTHPFAIRLLCNSQDRSHVIHFRQNHKQHNACKPNHKDNRCAIIVTIYCKLCTHCVKNIIVKRTNCGFLCYLCPVL